MITLHEEHGEVVASWARQGYRSESVICFDRHLDLKPLTEGASSRLRQLSDIADIESENRKLPIREVNGSFGLDDFYTAGGVLGLVSKLIWVRATEQADSQAARIKLLKSLSTIATEPDILEATYFDEKGALHTKTCGLDLVVHTPGTFAASKQSQASRVDIDLDWFADVQTGQDHQPAELLALLREHALDGNIDSMTFSVRSGFLPESRRSLATVLAQELGSRTQQTERDAIALPEATFASLRGQSGVANLSRYAEELAALGPVGVVLLGLLHLRTQDDLDRAGHAWQDAAEQGCRSAWLAYGVALSHYKAGSFEMASRWFSRAIGDQTDSIEVKSSFMVALCMLQSGAHEQAYQAILEFSSRYPLHINSARLAAEIGEQIGIARPSPLSQHIAAQRNLVRKGAIS